MVVTPFLNDTEEPRYANGFSARPRVLMSDAPPCQRPGGMKLESCDGPRASLAGGDRRAAPGTCSGRGSLLRGGQGGRSWAFNPRR